MAVFPDRIVLKNSTDDQATIEAAIGVGGADEITQGELVIGIGPTDAKFYTKAANGNIVSLGGSGVGATTLGELTDVDLTTTPPTNGQVIAYNSTSGNWEPVDQSIGGAVSINDLSDVDTSTVAPTDGQALVWNSTDGEWQPGTVSGSGISNIVEDTTPQLGGNLDVNNFYISSASGGDIQLAPDTTGRLVVRGNNTDGSITLNCTANTHGVTIQAPPHSDAATYTLILPSTVGTAGQVLTSQGGAQLTWEDAGSGGGATSIDELTDVDTSTTPPVDGQFLTWNATDGEWQPGDASGSAEPPSFVAAYVDPNSGSKTSVVLNVPTHSEGDVLVAAVMSRDAITPPTGWDIVGSYLNLAGVQNVSVFTKTATASEPASYTWTNASSARSCGCMFSVSSGAVVETVNQAVTTGVDASVATNSDRLNLLVGSWIWSISNGNGAINGTGVVDLTPKAKPEPRLSAGYTLEGGTATTVALASNTGSAPNVGIISIVLTSSSAGVTSVNGQIGDVVLGVGDLSDADTSTTPPTDGQALVWSSADGEWQPGTVASGGAVDSVNGETGIVVFDRVVGGTFGSGV